MFLRFPVGAIYFPMPCSLDPTFHQFEFDKYLRRAALVVSAFQIAAFLNFSQLSIRTQAVGNFTMNTTKNSPLILSRSKYGPIFSIRTCEAER